MTKGIYCYKDSQNNDDIVYVGLDSNIGKNTRHKRHFQPSRYDDQVINRVLQNNPDKYTYHVLKEGDFEDNLLQALEIIYIRRYSPQFNFTIGGDGMNGYTHSKESKKKISDALMGHEVSKETREKISKVNKGRKHSEEFGQKISERMSGINNHQYRFDIPSGKVLYMENRSGVTYKELCKKYGCCESLIITRIREHKNEMKSNGLVVEKYTTNREKENHPRYRHDIPNGKDLYFENLNGLSHHVLAKKYGCTKSTIGKRIRKYRKEVGLP